MCIVDSSCKMAVVSRTFTDEELSTIINVVAGDVDYDSMPTTLIDKLYEYFVADMPYGVAKARTGTPDEWILDHLHEIVG